MDVDLKLRTMFEEVYKTESVSQAAANIGATQPTISIRLGKLRRLFTIRCSFGPRAGWSPRFQTRALPCFEGSPRLWKAQCPARGAGIVLSNLSPSPARRRLALSVVLMLLVALYLAPAGLGAHAEVDCVRRCLSRGNRVKAKHIVALRTSGGLRSLLGAAK